MPKEERAAGVHRRAAVIVCDRRRVGARCREQAAEEVEQAGSGARVESARTLCKYVAESRAQDELQEAAGRTTRANEKTPLPLAGR